MIFDFVHVLWTMSVEEVEEKPKKKMRMWMDAIDEISQQRAHDISTDSSLKKEIERKLHNLKHIPVEELDLDHILSYVPYRSILENMFSNCTQVPADSTAQTLPIISKMYEETYMREPLKNENPCVFGNNCECQFIDQCAPFTAVEFRLFGDPPEPQMCVLCSRKTTQLLFYDMCYSGKSHSCVIQRYGNIFGQPGEYAVECMLSCPQGFQLHCMPLPMMSHQRNKYSVTTVGGVKKLQQHRVSYEHFNSPSGV